MQVEPGVHGSQLVAGELTDAAQAVAQRAAVDHQLAGGRVVVPAALVVLPERRHQVAVVRDVVVQQRAEPLPDELPHVAVAAQHPVEAQLVKRGHPARARRGLADAEREPTATKRAHPRAGPRSPPARPPDRATPHTPASRTSGVRTNDRPPRPAEHPTAPCESAGPAAGESPRLAITTRWTETRTVSVSRQPRAGVEDERPARCGSRRGSHRPARTADRRVGAGAGEDSISRSDRAKSGRTGHAAGCTVGDNRGRCPARATPLLPAGSAPTRPTGQRARKRARCQPAQTGHDGGIRTRGPILVNRRLLRPDELRAHAPSQRRDLCREER